MTNNRKRVKKHGLLCGGLIWIVLTVAFALLGVTVAAWQGGLSVRGISTTGYIDPVFTECDVRGTRGSGEVEVDVSSDGKRISIFIWDAEPGFTSKFQVNIENRGSLPVWFHTNTYSRNTDVKVTDSLREGLLEAGGDTASGELLVSVDGNATADAGCDFSVEMVFKQWNSVP